MDAKRPVSLDSNDQQALMTVLRDIERSREGVQLTEEEDLNSSTENNYGTEPNNQIVVE